tara:strand:- start:244 stop:1116 length:873 start_codon:yes stop_codon:yes gene_type:complete
MIDSKLVSFSCRIHGEKHPAEKWLTFGAVATKKDTSLHIFIDSEESAAYFRNNAALVLQQGKANLYPFKELHEISWLCTIGVATSRISLNRKNGLVSDVVFHNSAILQTYCSTLSMAKYNKALTSHQGLEKALWDDLPTSYHKIFTLPASTVYVVHTPGHPVKQLHQLTARYDTSSGEYPVVLVDTQKFIAHWKRQCRKGLLPWLKHLYPKHRGNELDNDDHEILSAPANESVHHSLPKEMACGVHLTSRQKIQFTNGRHRTVNFANLGAPFIPVQTVRHGLCDFKDRFE